MATNNSNQSSFTSGHIGLRIECICGGNPHEQKTDLDGCCTLRRSSCFSSNVWRLRRSGRANQQSRYRERFSFDGSLQVLSPSPSSLRVPPSSLLVAPRPSPLPLVVSPICSERAG